MISYNLIAPENMYSIIPMLQILNNKLPEELLKERLNEMMEKGYECLGIYDEEKLIGICGLWILTKYYIGRHIEPDNVMILPEYRNKGIGEQMMQWVYNYAKTKGCVASELNCYTLNEQGQKFWSNQQYQVIAFHYQKKFIE